MSESRPPHSIVWVLELISRASRILENEKNGLRAMSEAFAMVGNDPMVVKINNIAGELETAVIYLHQAWHLANNIDKESK